MSKPISVSFARTERSGKTFEVTATATFTRVPVTPANVGDWQALYDLLTRQPRNPACRPATPRPTPNTCSAAH